MDSLTAETYEADREALYEELAKKLPEIDGSGDSLHYAVADALNDALANSWYEGITYAGWRAAVCASLASTGVIH